MNETIKIRGNYRLIEADPQKALREYFDVLAFLKQPMPKSEAHRRRHDRTYRTLLGLYHDKAAVREHALANLVPTVGRTALARRLANDTTYTGIINYAAIGSSTTAPANGDTQLGTEVYRQTMSSQTYVNNVAYLSVFIIAGTATGTHSEAGLFIDGTGAANSGQLFSHVALSPAVVKGATNSLTLDISLTIS